MKSMKSVMSAVACLALAACATDSGLGLPSIPSGITDVFLTKVPFFIHAKSRDAANYRTVHINSALNTVQFSHGVEGALVNLTINETKYYRQVSHTPDGIRQSDSEALQVARRNGISALLTIGSGSSNVEPKRYQEQRSKCTVDTKLLKACPKGASITTTVSCESKNATTRIPVRLIDTVNGRTVYSAIETGSVKSNYCNDSGGEPESDNVLMARAGGLASEAIVRAISPREELRPLDIMAADKGLPKAKVVEFDKAIAFAKAKRLDRGCAIFDELYRDFTESKALAYNLGFCAETRGEMSKAYDLYERASQLAGAPDSKIDSRQIAIKKFIQENPAVLPTYEAPIATTGTSGGAVLPESAIEAIKGKKVALVIGNSRYEVSWLANPGNDARSMNAQLRRLGFDVTMAENIKAQSFQNVIAEFAQKAKGAGAAVVYYSGHGAQVNGENYLIPVDNSRIKSVKDLQQRALSLSTIEAVLDPRGAKLKIVILDACRNAPYNDGSRSGTAGAFAKAKTPAQGGLLAFSASPGSIAEDNATATNSLYTKLLVEALQVPNLPIEEIFKTVRARMRESGSSQIPSEVSSITGSFALNAK